MKIPSEKNFYPNITVPFIKNPNRFYAFPILGFLVKAIMLIPVGIEFIGLGLAVLVMLIINSFVVLFTGKYLDSTYNLMLGTSRLSLKSTFFMFGLTNSYPGFSLENSQDVKLDIPYPTKPNRLFAFPILGGLVRLILLIPYYIYSQVLKNGLYVGQLINSLVVLFNGRYTESIYEITRDQQRVGLASLFYIAGFSDSYPSFNISMNHKNIKIALIIIGAVMTLFNLLPKSHSNTSYKYRNYNYTNSSNYQYPKY